jgi:hypothetical protein
MKIISKEVLMARVQEALYWLAEPCENQIIKELLQKGRAQADEAIAAEGALDAIATNRHSNATSRGSRMTSVDQKAEKGFKRQACTLKEISARGIMRSGYVLAFAILIAGCATGRPRSFDVWVHPAPRRMAAALSRAEERVVFPVAIDQRVRAAEGLEAAPFIRLSREEAGSLAGKPLDSDHYFLIRGVCLGCGTGSFRAYFDGRNILVDHRSLARKGTLPTRWRVFADLENDPEEVFVECGAAR